MNFLNYNIMYNYREVARGLRDATPNSYAKKFDSINEAEKYIKDFKYKIVNKEDNAHEFSSQAAKRKRPESPKRSVSSLKDHIKKVIVTFLLFVILSS